MIDNPEIGRYLDVSTGHVPPKERIVLDDIPWPVYPYEYGWWVYAPSRNQRDPEEMQKCLPKRLRKLVFWASDHDLQFVRLDADGTVYEELEYFDE